MPTLICRPSTDRTKPAVSHAPISAPTDAPMTNHVMRDVGLSGAFI